MDLRRRARWTVALVGAAAIANGTGCSSGSDGPPSHLVDGTRARAPSVHLDATGPQVLTRVAATGAKESMVGTAARECLLAAREHEATGGVVVRTGVTGLSATFRTASGQALVGCDADHAISTDDTSWCGHAYGRLAGDRLQDPRLDLAGCSAPTGDTIAFAWITPRPETAFVAVRQDGYTEVYPAADGLPVRVTTCAIAADRSGATFVVSEHSASGALLRSSTLEVRVAG